MAVGAAGNGSRLPSLLGVVGLKWLLLLLLTASLLRRPPIVKLLVVVEVTGFDVVVVSVMPGGCWLAISSGLLFPPPKLNLSRVARVFGVNKHCSAWYICYRSSVSCLSRLPDICSFAG